MTQAPALRTYWGLRKTGLFGSFHAIQALTFGSVTPSALTNFPL